MSRNTLIPVHDVSWLGEWGINSPRDSFLQFGEETIPWPKKNVPLFSVQDYATLPHTFLLSFIRARHIGDLPKPITKASAIAALKNWDAQTNNRTQAEI
jgi:hypothetical protein